MLLGTSSPSIIQKSITGKAPQQAPNYLQLQCLLPQAFSLRENLKNCVCTRGGGGARMLQESLHLLRDLSYTTFLLWCVTKRTKKKKKGAVSEKCKKGTGSPVLWKVSETTGTTISSPRGVQRSHQAEPHVGIGITHPGVAGFQLSELFPCLKFRSCWLKCSFSLHCDPRARR